MTNSDPVAALRECVESIYGFVSSCDASLLAKIGATPLSTLPDIDLAAYGKDAKLEELREELAEDLAEQIKTVLQVEVVFSAIGECIPIGIAGFITPDKHIIYFWYRGYKFIRQKVSEFLRKNYRLRNILVTG